MLQAGQAGAVPQQEGSLHGRFGLQPTHEQAVEGVVDLALKSVKQLEQSVGYTGDQLIRVVQAAAETRPQAAAEIYRRQAEKLIKGRTRERYRHACTCLTTMRDLYRQMSQEPAWTDFMAEFRERHRRLRALQNELNKAGL